MHSPINSGQMAQGSSSQDNFSPEQMQRAFLQSAMVQNLQIQQQLLAQNQALQTLLSQQDPAQPNAGQSSGGGSSSSQNAVHKSGFKNRVSSSPFAEQDRNRKSSFENNNSHIPPPPPPPMPPPLEFHDPSGARPFLDPYGRAKTVRIGKWRWPPPQDGTQVDLSDENFMHFKLMRQNQRKQTPQSQNSNNSSPTTSVEWDEFEVDHAVIKNGVAQPKHQQQHQQQQQQKHQQQQQKSPPQQNKHRKYAPADAAAPVVIAASKATRRSFEIGADRPSPGSVGKLKLSSEMRQRLEQVTAGHSVRSSTSTKSDLRAPAKLEDARKMMLQQQLSGHFGGGDRHDEPDLPSVRTQVMRMEAGKRPPPPPWPAMVPPAPSVPAPPPPIRPPNMVAPVPIPPTQSQEMPAFYQRQERDTFGTHQANPNWNGSEASKDAFDSWGRAEAVKHDLYAVNYKKDAKNTRERSRSRSRSRDRENFSESVWDRSEVEGPPSTGSDRERVKEREKRERIYEMRQVERERESQKVYQPPNNNGKPFEQEREKVAMKSSQSQERATFKTHMTRMDRERKNSASTLITQSSDKLDDIEADEWAMPQVSAPAPIPPSLKAPAAACLTYNRVPWKLRVRKEVFHPSESIGSPAALDLLFAQVTSDVFGVTPCLRITTAEKRNAINLLGGHGVTSDNVKSQVRAIVKRHLIDLARSWPLYFARLFVVNGSPQMPEVSILAVSHSGVFLARRDTDNVNVVRSVPFAELQGAATLPRPAALQLNLRNGNRFVLHAGRASAIQTMVQLFCQEYRQVSYHSSTEFMFSILYPIFTC